MQSSKSQANIEVIFQNLNNAPNKNPATRSAVVATPLPLNSDSLFAPCGQMIMAFFLLFHRSLDFDLVTVPLAIIVLLWSR